MIDNITKAKILDAANIVDVVSDFVTLKRAGANYKGLCPFHDDRSPSFMVSPAKNFCKCFACGEGGNPVNFIMKHEQLSYPDALRWLAKKYGITIEEREMTAEEKASQTERESMFIVNEWANKWFQQQLKETPEGRNIGLTYFRGRGFRDDIIEKFQLGFSPTQRDACTKVALKAGYQEKFLISTPDDQGIAHGVGISIQRENGTLFDRFAGRVMFPIFTVSGKVVGFGGRVLDAATKGINVKYQNSPESVIYHKKSELYGLFQAKQAINKKDCVYMVEGYTDVISMYQSGVENIVASSGTALTHEQIRLLRRFTNNVVVIYDGDAAGIKASQRGIDMFLREGMNVRLLLLPDGKDPDDFAREHTPQELQKYMDEHQVDFIRFKSDLLLKEAQGDPIRLSNLVTNIVQSIAVIPDEIKRTLYIRETAQLMQLGEHLINDAVSKQVTKNIEEWRKEKEREERRNLPPTTSQAGRNAGNGHVAGAQTISATGQTPASDAGLQPAYNPTEQPPASDAGFPPAEFDAGVDIPPYEAGFPPVNDGLSQQAAASAQASRPVTHTPQPQVVGTSTNRQKADGGVETLIMQAIVRHGEKILCNIENESGQEQALTVTEFVYYSLEQDGLTLENPLYQQLLTEAMEHIHDSGFVAERFFINHPEQHVSSLAFDLSTDHEELSSFYKKNDNSTLQEQYNLLMELVTHLLTDLKLSIVKKQKAEIMTKMRDPNVLSDRGQYRALMQRFQEVKELEAKFAKACGDRVISK